MPLFLYVVRENAKKPKNQRRFKTQIKTKTEKSYKNPERK